MPELAPWLQEPWGAFWKLSKCRQIGMGVGPIPWTAINDYSIRYGIAGDEFEEFEAHIDALDSAYLEHQRPKDN